MALNGTLFGGVYRAVCQETWDDRIRVQIPQLFASEMVTVFESAGPRPSVGDEGWVSFESGLPEHPVWMGSESKGSSGSGMPVWPPYHVVTVPVSVDNAAGGYVDVVLLDGSYQPAFDGWFEMIVSGGYGGNSTTSVNVRQSVYSSALLDPTGQPWIVFGAMASPGSGAWDMIGDCSLSVPVTKDQTPTAYWRGNWAPSTSTCSFRSNVTVKFYSAAGQTDTMSLVGPSGAPGAPGPPGPTGPSGPPGPPGTGAAGTVSYHHIQTVATTSWVIDHGLGFYPNVTVVDSSGREVVPGAVVYTSATSVTLTFSAAFGGDAYLS